jgi:hypothetical protein
MVIVINYDVVEQYYVYTLTYTRAVISRGLYIKNIVCEAVKPACHCSSAILQKTDEMNRIINAVFRLDWFIVPYQ